MESESKYLFVNTYAKRTQTLEPTYIYLSERITIEYFLTVPIVCYGIFLFYIIHISKKVELSLRKINKRTLKLKKKFTFLLTAYFFYQFILGFFLGYSKGSADLFLFLFLTLFEMINTILTPFVIRELSKKVFQIPYKNYLYVFWAITSFKVLLEVIIEIRNGLFFKLMTFSTFGLVGASSLSYLFYKYPRDDSYPGNNEVYYELQFLPLIAQDDFKYSFPRKDEKKKEYSSSSLKRFKPALIKENFEIMPSHRSDTKNLINHNNNISLDDLSQNQPEILPHYPKIEIQLKGDYKYYQTNFFKFEDDFSGKKEDIFHNFYFQIVVRIYDKNICHVVKRSIKDFLELERDIKMEFKFNKYSKKLTEALPHLKLPLNNCKNVEFFKKYKINFEMFLKSIVNEPCYITDDVLNFLHVNDEHLSFSYNLIRNKNLNVTRITDDTFMNPNRMLNYDSTKMKAEDDDVIIRESIIKIKHDLHKITDKRRRSSINTSKQFYAMNNLLENAGKKHLSGSNFHIPTLTSNNANVKIKILDIKRESSKLNSPASEFCVCIRVSQNNMFRILHIKLAEVMKMIVELSNLNKSNENIKNIIKLASTIDEDSFSSLNKFTSLLENVVQNSYDNLKLYNHNQIINDFFFEFADDSKTVSRCESFATNNTRELNYTLSSALHIQNNAFNITSPKSNEKKFFETKKKHDLIYYHNLIEQSKIKSVDVNISNYNVYAIEFKTCVFYVLNFKLLLKNGGTESINKKYKYKELNEFVNMMRIKLKISNKFTFEVSLNFKSFNDKLNYRQIELNKNLKEIFGNINLDENKEWEDLLKRDHKYQLIKQTKQNQAQAQNKPSIIFKHRTESKESFLGLNIRDSIC